MRIHVQPEAVDDLLVFLRQANCKAEVAPDGSVVIEVPEALGDEQERMELELYLKAWQVNHPDFESHVLDSPRSSVEDGAKPAD